MRFALRPVFRPITPVLRPQSQFVPSQRARLLPSALLNGSAVARSFSTTSPLLKRKGQKASAVDPRLKLIRYSLKHPKTPRPLRFSRHRSLRHWTIHRAWMLYTAKRRKATELSLERNYLAMRDACEHLRLMDGNGISVSEEEAQRRGKEVGYFFRVAMLKNRVWGPSGGFPIEYARAQTDYPGKEAWNHSWTR